MDANLKSEINSCIQELRSIANQLDDAADEVKDSITGMMTWQYTNALYISAGKYRTAANNLEKIK